MKTRQSMLLIIFVSVIVYLIAGFAKAETNNLAKDFECKVVKIRDGDTFLCADKYFSIYVRLADIDAPEKKSKFGEKAKTQLANLMPIGSNVKLKIYGQDRYFRSIATVYLNSVDINAQMLKKGMALVYLRYLHKDKKELYLKIEQKAKESKLGIWSLKNENWS